MTTKTILADYPAYTIVAPAADAEFQHGDIIALPQETKHYGTLWNFYSLVTAEGLAAKWGWTMEQMEASLRQHNEPSYWASPEAVVLHDGPKVKETRPGVQLGDTIRLAGKQFVIEPAPNRNIRLREVAA